MLRTLIIVIFGISTLGFFYKGTDIAEAKKIRPGDLAGFKNISVSDSVKTCLECHDGVTATEEVHPPVKKSCDRCHVSTGNEHPNASAAGFTLAAAVPQLCYECHDKKDELEKVHDPVAKGDCFKCHNPHGSDYLYLLKTETPGQLCEQCHTLETAGAKTIHQPLKDGTCTGCHNPHQSDYEHLVNDEGPMLCRSCHRSLRNDLRAEHVHAPFKENCFNCHNPHTSTEAHLLDQKPLDLCMNCHKDFVEEVHKLPNVHGAIATEKSCTGCHTPHSSSEKHILLAKEREVCLNCHSEEIKSETGTVAAVGEFLAEGNTIHKPIEENGCTVCHKPHSTDKHDLLVADFPEGSYAAAEVNNFILCFMCHSPDLFQDKETESGTNFRDGKKNLHFTHVNGQKGRNCTMCHNVHGSKAVKLIAENVKFGNWDMPIKYTPNEKGGSCMPGCHEKKTYTRSGPAMTGLNETNK